jgi:signal peptidase I
MAIAPRKSLPAIVLTVFLPGLGHIYCGKMMQGLAIYFISIVISFACAFIFISPFIKYGAYAGIFIIFLFYILMMFHAARTARIAGIHYELKTYNKWSVYLAMFLILGLVIGAVKSYIEKINIAESYKVSAKSMQPTLLTGDHFLVNKYIYKTNQPQRGDIVVFVDPSDPSKYFIKRVVGLGGDTVEIRNKHLFINGQKYSETYILNAETEIYPSNTMLRDNYGPIEVPQNNYFVLGDNRDEGYDSLFRGFVDRAKIKGKAISIYFSWDEKSNRIRWDRLGKTIE